MKLPRACFELNKNPWKTYGEYTILKLKTLLFILIDINPFQEWSTKDIVLWTKKIEILPMVASDHNPLMWYAQIGGGGTTQLEIE